METQPLIRETKIEKTAVDRLLFPFTVTEHLPNDTHQAICEDLNNIQADAELSGRDFNGRSNDPLIPIFRIVPAENEDPISSLDFKVTNCVLSDFQQKLVLLVACHKTADISNKDEKLIIFLALGNNPRLMVYSLEFNRTVFNANKIDQPFEFAKLNHLLGYRG